MVTSGQFMIDPRQTHIIGYWDIITSLSLLFVALITPFEIAFLEPATSVWEPVFVLNQFITLIFILDAVLQFFLMVEIETPEGPRWASEFGEVASYYMRGWFVIDAASIATSALDYLSLFESADDFEQLRVLRILRALRLMKLVKLVSGAKIIRRNEVKFAINYAMLSLFQCVLGMLLLSHWFAW